MKNSNFQKNYSYAICMVVLVLLEVYLMINYPNLWIVIIADALLIILCICLTISLNVALAKEKEEKKQAWQEEIQNINKSEKANYLLLKKSFLDLEDRFMKQDKMNLSITNAIDVSERKIQKAIMQIMEEDKKVARISVGRSKENADFVINSNNELKRKMLELEKRLDDIDEKMNSVEDLITTLKTHESGEDQYQNIITSIEQMEKELKAYITSNIPKDEQTVNETEIVNESSYEEEKDDFEVVQDSELVLSEIPLEENDIQGETILEEEPEIMDEVLKENFDIEDTEKITESEEINQEQFVEEEVFDNDQMNDQKDIPSIEEPVTDTFINNIDMEETVELNSDIFVSNNMENESNSEEVLSPETMDDPNKMMTPDDIAALLAGIGSNEAKVESEPEPVVEPEPEPDVVLPELEEKPITLDESNPNKMMTPDEIAALIAGL